MSLPVARWFVRFCSASKPRTTPLNGMINQRATTGDKSEMTERAAQPIVSKRNTTDKRRQAFDITHRCNP